MVEMKRESSFPMVPVPDALALIAAHTPLLPVETLRAVESDGRVLAEDILADADIPAQARSTVDGYAIRAADLSIPRRVLGELTAGSYDTLSIGSGDAVRIMTGAPLPVGADAVIRVEETEEQGGIMRMQRDLRPGDFVLQPGSDVSAGQVVLRRGDTIGPPEIGLLATLGRATIPVFRRPVVAVLSTGDEVVEPDTPMPEGFVRDANRYTLMAAARAAGCETISLGIGRDNDSTLRRLINEGLSRADVLLSSGGVSMGTRDLIKPLLAELGTIHFGRVFFKPGKPTAFATVGKRLAFGLPGNPASALISFEVFVRPTVRRMQGDSRPDRPLLSVTLAESIRPSDRLEYQRAIIRWQDGQLVAYSTGSQSSSRLLSLYGANALLIVPAGTAPLPVGSTLHAMLTDMVRM